jgi:PAS domain S-box-containing protein
MPQIVWTALPNGVLNYYNRKWFEFVNLPEDIGVDADWAKHVHPDDLPAVAAEWSTVLKTGDPYHAEFRVRSGDGEYRDFLVRALPIRDENGAIVHWFGTCTDISDRKRIEADREQLLVSERAARAESERAGQMKDEFLATLSHEIRTPLNAILGWSQIMRGSNDPEDIAQGLDVIERNARAQSQIVEDLLDMSKIISGKVRLDVQRLDLSTIVRTAVETARPTADAKGLRLHSVIDPLIGVVVSGDANRLQQVLWNLISNAVKFTPRGGRIQVLLERVNSHLEISVIDSGEGIRPEFLPYVFDRFRQADASTTRRHGGLGLGLSIVKQLVELHGGSVRVKSAGPGHGTTFVVALPLVVLHSEPAGEPERRHPTAKTLSGRIADNCDDIAGLRVLVIDDEPDARALVKRLLEDCHAIVTATGSVHEAVEEIRTGNFDVLVSDIGMPGEDGYSLIRRVRALGPANGGNIPAIALTAYARAEDRVKAVSAGFQMHVTKPVEPIELVTMVAGAAGRTGQR